MDDIDVFAHSATLLACLLLAGCGGSGTASPDTATASPPATIVAPPVSPFVELSFAYEAHRIGTKDIVPPYIYAGVNYPGGVADILIGQATWGTFCPLLSVICNAMSR